MKFSMSWDEILDEARDRQEDQGELFNYMRDARNHFNGDIPIPLPELEADEKPAVANLVAQGLDQTAMRVASVLPDLYFPAVQPGKDTGNASEDWARKRRLAVTGWWQESRLNLKLRRASRWVIGYGVAPMTVRPNFKTGIPQYVLRHPMSSLPSPNVDYDDDQPFDFIFVYRRTYKWLMETFPDAAQRFWIKNKRIKPSATIEVIEYDGPFEHVLGVVAANPRDSLTIGTSFDTNEMLHASGEEILRVDNKAGICTSVCADRITIDRLIGQFNQVFGIYQSQAKLMALETIAVTKAIFPDLVMVGSSAGRTPQLVSGPNWKDGRTGEINIVKDGNVDAVQINPGFMTQPLIDRHERAIRSTGVPAQFSGETPTNIATGRLGQNTLSASVDYPIQEYQEILASTLHDANVRAIEVAKGYFGEEKKTFHVSFAGTSGRSDYKPNTHFETSEHHVRYAAPGADLNSLVIGIGQRVGIGTLSRKTAMMQDPMVNDPEFEYRQVTSERVQTALTDYIATAVAQGQVDPMDVVILTEEIEKGATMADAWRKAQEAAQQRQAEAAEAQQGQPQTPGIPPGEAPVTPESQPGLSPQSQGEEAGAAIQAPQPSQQNLAALMNSLSSGARTPVVR